MSARTCSVLSVVFGALAAAAAAQLQAQSAVSGGGLLDGIAFQRGLWAKSVEADQKAVVFVGGPEASPGPSDLSKSFPGMKVANRALSGDTTVTLLERLDADVLALNPTAVLVAVGRSDLGRKTNPELIAANLTRIIAALKNHNAKMPIILCKVFPGSAQTHRPAQTVKRLNQLYGAAVKGDPQVILVETWELFADENGDARESEFHGRTFLNRHGSKKWVATLRPIFATLGYLETGPDDFRLEEGFESLFNGVDLTGWRFRASGNPKRKSTPARPVWKEDHVFDGKTQSIDGRYKAINGRLVVTTPPQGRRFQQMWTTREFSKDFVLKLEFRATAFADSGVFIRKPQLQCRDFLLAGPWKDLEKYKPQDWNELVVTVKGDLAHCTCNGEVLDAAMKVPASGPIGLEGDRGQMEYRRIRIKEL